jgi:hypothetical protein
MENVSLEIRFIQNSIGKKKKNKLGFRNERPRRRRPQKARTSSVAQPATWERQNSLRYTGFRNGVNAFAKIYGNRCREGVSSGQSDPSFIWNQLGGRS